METKHWTRRAFTMAIGVAVMAIAGCTMLEPTAEMDSNMEMDSTESESVVLSLPDGFAPDGITIASDGTIYLASIYDGTIVRGRVDGTEIVDVIVEGQEGRPGWGMDLDEGD